MSLTKVAIVTGSNKGIGFEIVKGLCLNFNGHVYLTSRNSDNGHNAIKRLEKEGYKVHFHQLDIDDSSSILELKKYILETYGGVDILVNNAAVLLGKNDSRPLSEKIEQTIKTNYFSTLDISKVFLPLIKPNGRVVNVSSYLGISALQKCSSLLQSEFRSNGLSEDRLSQLMRDYVDKAKQNKLKENGWPENAYDVSKLALILLSKIHADWITHHGNKNVLLNSCCPGWVRTDMGGSFAPKSTKQGAETPLYLALLPEGSSSPHGEFVSEKKIQKW